MILLTSKELYIIMYPHWRSPGNVVDRGSKSARNSWRSLSFLWTAIADVLLVSQMTIYRRRTEYGLLEAHSAIHDRELIEFVRHTLVQ